MRKLFLAIGLLLAAAVASPAQVTIFGTAQSSSQPVPNAQGVELGVKFRSDVSGLITGIRFYKGSSNTGQHTGSLWSSSGQSLAIGTFSGESATGWQQLTFSSPFAIAANTTYVASYHTNSPFFADANFFLNQGVNSPPLHALQNGVDGGNGVYVYSPGGAFPNLTYSAYNYWVDVVFATSRFKDNGDGTITDNVTGLMWEKKNDCSAQNLADIHCVLNGYSWSINALDPNGTLFSDFLAKMNSNTSTSSDGINVVIGGVCLAGHCDWRIPNVAELKAILFSPTCSAPCLDPAFGPAYGTFYWSSSTNTNNTLAAWGVQFGSREVFDDAKNHGAFARAVHGGR